MNDVCPESGQYLTTMKSYIRILVIATSLFMLCSCEVAKMFFGPWTLDAPTTCLIDGIRFSSSPEEIPRQFWPGTDLQTTENSFSIRYSRDLKSADSSATLVIDLKIDEVFEICKEYECTGSITLEGTKYAMTEGWIMFRDYNSDAQSAANSCISAAFEFSAQSESGDIVQITEGTFEELWVNHYY